MPNHIASTLIVTGIEAEITRFKEVCLDGEGKLSCDKVIPYPEEFKEKDRIANEWYKENCIDGDRWKGTKEGVSYSDAPKDGFNQGGYNWCCDSWGTKWGFYDLDVVSDDPDELEFRFNTAWSPATPVFEKMVEMFPTLKFRYYGIDEGFNYAFCYIGENGVPKFYTLESEEIDKMSKAIREELEADGEIDEDEFDGSVYDLTTQAIYDWCSDCE